jgi:alpha-methylacyl-CoA racemase
LGPLDGVRIVEFAGIGPGPFCGMILADMGADVIRVERKSRAGAKGSAVLNRGRQSVVLDLKNPKHAELALGLVRKADGLIEGFRPGVMERLGLGPDPCLERNPRLIYGRVTGWGQTGPLRDSAGHDINYIALSGALHVIGTASGNPLPPINLVGDFGGGGLLLAFGIVCGIFEARTSGRGQVVDAAMTDGAALLMTMIYGRKAAGNWKDKRGSNMLDGGAPFYRTYKCADGKYVAVGPLEPRFYGLLLRKLGLSETDLQPQMDANQWSKFQNRLAATFRTQSRDEWCNLLEGTDACVAPVLNLEEAPKHVHNLARETFIEVDGTIQPAPAPRFSRTPGRIRSASQFDGQRIVAVLSDWGLTPQEIEALRS